MLVWIKEFRLDAKIHVTSFNHLKCIFLGSGCGSVGRAIASNTRGPQFESRHQKIYLFLLNICLLSTVYWKDENKEKEAGDGPFFIKSVFFSVAM